MPTPLNRITSILFIVVLGVVALVSAWDYLAGSEEKWIHYVKSGKPTILGEYESEEECSEHMNSHKDPSACRRVDGPYSVINTFADIVL